MHLEGTPSDQLPRVLATGRGDAGFVFISLSARHPQGRDAEYLEWHSLDHRPEQYRLAGLRNTMRLVSTPGCRARRAASEPPFDAVDHIMTYQFADDAAMPGFTDLGAALDEAGRMAIRLPSVGYLTGSLAGKIAAPRAAAGADVIPWRPATGVYLIIEEGLSSPEALLEVPEVAGIWWFEGTPAAGGVATAASGRQITYCYLDGDPATAAEEMAPLLKERWQGGGTSGLLAAPFYSIVPFEWTRHLP
jgi:hypothetical protein